MGEFEKERKPGWFKKFSRKEIATSLRGRIQNPYGTKQGDSMLCGPAAFICVMAAAKPHQYARLVTELYNTGSGYVGEDHEWWSGDTIHAGTLLKDKRPPAQARIPPADWIAMASIRSDANWLLDFDRKSVARVGTYPNELGRWLRNIGFSQVIDETVMFFATPWGAKNLLATADRYYSKGYWVFLNVHADILRAGNTSTWSIMSNHWVVLTSPIIIKAKTVDFELFTWGAKQSVGGARSGYKKSQIDKQDFLDHFYGFVAAGD